MKCHFHKGCSNSTHRLLICVTVHHFAIKCMIYYINVYKRYFNNYLLTYTQSLPQILGRVFFRLAFEMTLTCFSSDHP